MPDLTTEFYAKYVDSLRDANPTKRDSTSLVADHVDDVRAAVPTEIDDANTMYERYIV